MATTTSASISPTTVNGKTVAPAEEPVVPEVKAASASDNVEIELMYEFVNNYTQSEAQALGYTLDAKGRCVFGPGKVTVDRDTADDLQRRQAAVIKSEYDLIHAHDKTSGELAHVG